VRELTTTSYAILSLLAVRSWTTYELAQQMDRSVGRMWSRAASVVYEEPKRLALDGLATTTRQYTGKRASTVYSITAKGRRTLRRWLEEPGGEPTMEFEALLKVAFADQGSLDGLRANLSAIRAYAEAEHAYGAERMREYATTGGPHPERLPVIALASRFFKEQAAAIQRWVDWAEAAIEEWDGVTPDTGARVPDGAFEPD
jgi:PadR family transcriptional regulator, regulatory protein AphA